MQTKVLLLISSDVERDAQSAASAPRRDYKALAEELKADVLDFGSVKKGKFSSIALRLFGRGITHALLARTKLKEYDVVYSDNEHLGLFLAILMRTMRNRPRHVLLAHHLSPKKKRPFIKLARPRVDRLILHSPAQLTLAVEKLHFRSHEVLFLPYQVDTRYWQAPAQTTACMIATAGLECRDYLTLLEAIQGLPLRVCIGAASHWSKKRNALSGQPLPANLTVSTYNYEQLKNLYSESMFVVVPLIEIDFQAGITTVLEAMSMGKAVIVSKTKGMSESVVGPLWAAGLDQWPKDALTVEESSGILVPPGDPAALRSAITYLQERPAVAFTLGQNGRKRVESDFTVEQFAQRFAKAIASAAQA